MKATFLTTLSVLALTACTNQSSVKKQNNEQQISIGGNKDQHGCLVAAGQTWSKLKNTCIQVFNVGIRLNPIEAKTGEAIYSAFIVYNNDKTSAELFLPNNDDNKILVTVDKKIYTNGLYNFNATKGILSINGKANYIIENKQ